MNGLRLYAIYRNPTDFPDRFVVRGWTATREGARPDPNPLAVVGSLEDARRAVPLDADACLGPSPGDDPVIVETWL